MLNYCSYQILRKKHTIILKIELKMQQDELKSWHMMTWKISWKNDIGFAQPPSPNKMSLLFIHLKFDFFLTPPPFCTKSFFLLFFFLKSSLTNKVWLTNWQGLSDLLKISVVVVVWWKVKIVSALSLSLRKLGN